MKSLNVQILDLNGFEVKVCALVDEMSLFVVCVF
jgi:hypothetical protein